MVGVRQVLMGVAPSRKATFPLSLSANGRYVQTASGSPFLINEAGGWGLTASVTLANAKDFIDKRAAQGFNTMKIALIWTQGRTSPFANQNGDAPFGTAGNFSTASAATAYWNNVDAVLDYARSKGFFCLLVPCYLGYGGDASQGWATTMNADTDAHCTTFGTFLGNRYASRDHIAWLLGGDQVPGNGVDGSAVILSRFTSVVNAIRAVDSAHFVTAHYAGDYALGVAANDPKVGGMLSSDFSTTNAIISLNGLYSYDPQEETYLRMEDARAIAPAIPYFPLDQSYNTNGGDPQPQGTPAEVRAKSYKNMCTGACGNSFTDGSPWYKFTDWTSVSQAQTEAVYWWQFWKAMPWSSMAPDQSNTFVTAGRGTHGSSTYVCVLAASSGYLVAYFPSGAGTNITVDKSQFSRSITAFWRDPTSGTEQPIGTLSNSGTDTFGAGGAHPFPSSGINSAGDSDWVLVFR